jgi:molybdenum cofactor cytidylyltransferase
MPTPLADSLRVAGIILAAGTSSRLGTNKLFLELSGESLIRRAVRTANEAALSRVIVVAGHESERVQSALRDADCEVVVNPDYRGPMSASMHRGLDALGDDIDAALVMLVDMVHVTTDMVREIARTAGESPAPIVVSRYADVTAPPILFKRALFPELLAWNGEGCGRAVLRAHAGEAIAIDWPLERLADVDITSDWERVRSIGD